MRKAILIVLGLAATAVPALSQNVSYSESYTFLKGVRERDAAAVTALVTRPNSTVINARELGTGEGALHILVRGRDHSWLSFMLGRGARPDLQSSNGTTPLNLAAQLGWSEGADLLLGRGANPNLGNSRGETPLIFAVQRRDVAMVRLLLGRRANPNQTDNVAGYSALDYARQDRRGTAVLRLLEQRR